MSSSRSVAAARARRAPETPSQSAFKPQNVQQQQQQMQQQQSRSKPPMTPYQPKQGSLENKLSVSDAFALVTIRLGRVELLLQKWQSMGVEGEGGVHIPAATSNTSDVANTTIIKSLVSRIDDLERNIKASAPTKDIEANLSMLSEKNVQLHNELREAKDAIYKLQSMTLDTSQKIMTMMMSKNAPEVVASSPLMIEIPVDKEDVDEVEVVLEDASVEDLEQATESIVEESSEQNVILEVESQIA